MNSFRSHGIMILSCLWDLALWGLFLIGVLSLIDFSGLSFGTYCGVGLLYSFTAGHRWVTLCPKVFSYAVLPMLIPCYFIFWKSGYELFWGMDDLIILPLCLSISRLPLYWQSSTSQTFFKRQQNRIFLILLQGIYGVLIHACNPLFLEQFEWTITPSFKPGERYESTAHDLQLYYDDPTEAERIDILLPGVIETLKTSPFFSNSASLILCQKNNFDNPHQQNDDHDNHILGHYHPWKRHSYVYFADEKNLDLNGYRVIMKHELTHQMVHRFYGVFSGLFGLIPLWKDEGYAEYIAYQEELITKEELLKIIETDPIVTERLYDPFSPNRSKSQYGAEDYQAAYIQTRYALDYKKIDPKDFFRNSYSLAPVKEIQEWLISVNADNME